MRVKINNIDEFCEALKAGYLLRSEDVYIQLKENMFYFLAEELGNVSDPVHIFQYEKPEPLKLEVGKFYKTRDGRKAFVYTRTEDAAYPCWVVLVNSSEGGTYCCTVDGQYTTNEEHNKDLVAPWEE